MPISNPKGWAEICTEGRQDFKEPDSQLYDRFAMIGTTAGSYSVNVRKRNELPITLTEESAMAAAAMMGDSRMPKVG